MRSFITGLVVAALISTTATAGDALLWEEDPTQTQLWSNVNALLDKDDAIFGGVPASKFEPIVVDEDNQVYATPGQEELGIVLVNYIDNKKVDVDLVPAESNCEDEQGNLTASCDDMDFIELGADFAAI